MQKPEHTVLLLKPIFKERIWGGNHLHQFGYELPSGSIGECWGISGHPEGESMITQGQFKGKTLGEIYRSNPSLFNFPKTKNFPLLVKIIDAKADLSVQVHPNDAYALAHENQLGKHEAWLVLATQPNTRLQLGHRAKDADSFKRMVHQGKWKELLQYRPLHQDEVIDIPPGTLHALCAGTMVLEIQQSSDVTYRVYDYERLDASGRLRPLHLSQAMAVTTCPFVEPKVNHLNRNLLNQLQFLIQNQHFTISAIGINQALTLPHPQYRLVSVIEGEVTIQGVKMVKGQHAVITGEMQSLSLAGRGWVVFAEAKLN